MKDTRLALKRFYEQVGQKYPEEEKVYHTLRGILRKKFVLSHLQRFRGSLLDIGCNRGMYLQAYQGGHRFGVDLSLSVLKKIPKQWHIHLTVADAERLQCFKPGSFDNALCSEVLEHCLDPQAVFNSIAHVLRAGGYALVTTPNYKRQRPRWIGLGVLQHFGVDSDCEEGYFHTAYRPEELERFARAAGLKVISVGTLEKEVKYAAKVPAAILLTGRLVNKVFRSTTFEKLNESFFDRLTLLIYYFCHYTALEIIFLKFIRNGVRSYILMQKETEENL